MLVHMKTVALIGVMALAVSAHAAGTKASIDTDGYLSIDGKKMFVISVAVPPPPDGKTPGGKEAYEELHDGGCNFLRVTMKMREEDEPKGPRWTAEGFDEIQESLDALAKAQMYGWVYLYELGDISIGSGAREPALKKVIERFKDHPAVGGWKGADEPAWSFSNDKNHKRCSPENILHVYKLIHELDKNHPVLILHAPKGEWQSLVPYMAGTDITGMDIFPIGYPNGRHGDLPNRDISVVGDYTRWMRQAAGKKPVWMTLQVAWSGASKQSTLRFPTFPQERFMTYEAIIWGARGVNYFGGGIEASLNERDKPLGYNWTFWERVLRPVLEEINEKSALGAALVVGDAKLKIGAEQMLSVPPGNSVQSPPNKPPVLAHYPAAHGLDFCVREAGEKLFIIAAKREGDTVMVRFTGLPAGVAAEGDVLYESPRKIKIENGVFEDWFGPEEVHVYRIKRGGR